MAATSAATEATSGSKKDDAKASISPDVEFDAYTSRADVVGHPGVIPGAKVCLWTEEPKTASPIPTLTQFGGALIHKDGVWLLTCSTMPMTENAQLTSFCMEFTPEVKQDRYQDFKFRFMWHPDGSRLAWDLDSTSSSTLPRLRSHIADFRKQNINIFAVDSTGSLKTTNISSVLISLVILEVEQPTQRRLAKRKKQKQK